ncbi:MAG TPA: TetR/AcrR family transcriptional regulator [Paenibacillus sp.]|nr:TetR/AcrR family transcriptional regulator [Paenibacillus sp.]
MSDLPRKDSITLTAIGIVHESGFQGLTTREIAKREGISEAALYRHFKNRNDIVAAVVAYYANQDHDIVASLAELDLGPAESVAYIIERMAAYYEEHPAVSAIMNAFDSMQYDAEQAQTASEIYRFRKLSVERLLRKAQAEGTLRRAVDPELLSSVIWSAFFAQVYEWRGQGYSYSLRRKTSEAITMLLDMATENGVME